MSAADRLHANLIKAAQLRAWLTAYHSGELGEAFGMSLCAERAHEMERELFRLRGERRELERQLAESVTV